MTSWKIGQYSVRIGGAPAVPARQPAPPVENPEAARWGAEGDRLRMAGEHRAADQAYARQMRAAVRDPDLVRAAEALLENRLRDAEAILLDVTRRRPADVQALWMLAEVASRTGRNPDAERLLARCLELAPGFTPARYARAMVLNWLNRVPETLAEAERLLATHPGHPVYRHLRASALLRLGDDPAAAEAYGEVLADEPDQPLTWMSYGHALKTIGRQDEAVAAYRRSLALRPGLGEAWWSLANLKTVRFTPQDVADMDAAMADPDLAEEDRLYLAFALGKAREDLAEYEAAFRLYAEGNALQRRRVEYDANETTTQMRRAKALMTPGFFASRAGQGTQAGDPIFVVGLPRSGSTLVEQILASHSRVEGTQELPHIPAIAARLAGRARRESEGAYPDILAALGPDELAALGAEYLERARIHRKTGRPFFVDKLPNNFAHVGLIHLILPNARIIDARRHPLGCCFSAFKQHFAVGQTFTYDLTDLGRYYADYVELMAHFDAVLPGRVHRVIYEEMVADPEGQTRALLDYCGLPFEDACLRFYENDRAVRTASSEQVRKPIFTDAAGHWRHFEPWLGPLKAALGPVLEAYPRAPAN